ncbi:unnamed protein product [Linum trigynum]|uniref:Uncharacterized protein n=1 Tax=Linum trigynum TaxID=586398 RepID=A0AAV2DEA3_9ROSI
MLKNEEGNKVTDLKELGDIAEGFYKRLMGRKHPYVIEESDEFYSELLRKTLSSDEGLCDPDTEEEVKSVVFAMNGDKSPGLDGYSAAFFQHVWPVTGAEVTFAIQTCFHDSKMPREVNATILALVPKIQNPDEMRFFLDLSPIAILSTKS